MDVFFLVSVPRSLCPRSIGDIDLLIREYFLRFEGRGRNDGRAPGGLRDSGTTGAFPLSTLQFSVVLGREWIGQNCDG